MRKLNIFIQTDDEEEGKQFYTYAILKSYNVTYSNLKFVYT